MCVCVGGAFMKCFDEDFVKKKLITLDIRFVEGEKYFTNRLLWIITKIFMM